MKQACNFPRLHNCQTLAQPRAIESERTQMWQTFTSYLHLPRLRPCFPDRVCSANGIERGRLSFFASSSAHASVIYFSLSSFSKDFTTRKLRNRITLSRNEGIPPSHIFISLLRDHSTVRVLSSRANSSGLKRNIPRIFSSSFLSFKISR